MKAVPSIIGCSLVALTASAQDGATLDGLAVVHEGRSRAVSSAAKDAWSNGDNRWVKAGDTLTLAEIAGPGTIRHVWLTFPESSPSWISNSGSADPSEIVLRCYWDGATDPAVEAPIGDFFAAGFGERAEIRSTPVQVQGGDAYNCYWPMPFAKSARVTITNESERPIAALYYQIDYTEDPLLSPQSAHFCAQYRQEFPTVLGHDYLILDAEGPGHYVGTVMSVRSRSPQWFGEGDAKFQIDGEERPSIWGTGTEDYFLNAWGMEKATFPSFGVTRVDGWLGDLGDRGTFYRWHLADPVRFTKSLRATIEHAGWMSADETTTGKVEGFVERQDDFATVAFWYQKGQPKRFTTLPSAKERRLPSLDDVIEGKTLLASAKASGGSTNLQKGAPWTGDGQVFFDAKGEGSSLTLNFTVAAAEDARSRTVLAVTHSYDFGIYRITLDGAPVGEPIDFYSPTVEVHDLTLSEAALAPGAHVVRLDCVGKNATSTGTKLGVDSVRLRHRWNVKRPPLGPPPR
ncbi:MAG: DUF2961 domain-containing protein [Planctomycetes bacterium]|nr:DUF2961 domain-containing protein [Planctomycetota bacterium]